MKKYACDVCGLTFNDYGHFENGEPCNMYELQMIFDGSGTYEENIICERCFEKILFNKCKKEGNDEQLCI